MKNWNFLGIYHFFLAPNSELRTHYLFLFRRWSDAGVDPATLSSLNDASLLIDIEDHPLSSNLILSFPDHRVSIQNDLILLLLKSGLLTGRSAIQLDDFHITDGPDLLYLFRLRLIKNDQRIGMQGGILLRGHYIPFESNCVLFLIRLHRIGDNVNGGAAGRESKPFLTRNPLLPSPCLLFPSPEPLR